MSEENGKYWVGNIRGVKGLKGDNATITGATASVSNTTGTPSVIVSTGGTESARSFHFDFFGLKGEPGIAGKDATLDVNKITPTYTEATTLTNVESGEALSVAFGKIKKAISSLISHLADTTKHITSAERTALNNVAKLQGTYNGNGTNREIDIGNDGNFLMISSPTGLLAIVTDKSGYYMATGSYNVGYFESNYLKFDSGILYIADAANGIINVQNTTYKYTVL